VIFFFEGFSSRRNFEAENDGEIEGRAKAKGLIAQKGKVGCTEEKMREDEDGRGEGL
jgi:hypothetical protein